MKIERKQEDRSNKKKGKEKSCLHLDEYTVIPWLVPITTNYGDCFRVRSNNRKKERNERETKFVDFSIFLFSNCYHSLRSSPWIDSISTLNLYNVKFDLSLER